MIIIIFNSLKTIQMKKNLMFMFIVISLTVEAQLGSFRITSSSAVQIGYNNYKFLSLGSSTGTTNNGAWALESWDAGLNFWKPYPTYRAGNYKLFISDYGAVSIAMRPYTVSVPRHDINTFKLQVNGRIAADGLWNWSDEKLKKDVTNLDTSLQQLMALRPVSYHFIPGIKIGDTTGVFLLNSNSDSIKYSTALNETAQRDTDETLHYGFIAQEVKTVIPNLVADLGDLKALNYVELIPVLVRAIQQQQKLIQDLRDEVIILKNDTLDYGANTSKLFQNTPNPFTTNTTIGYYIDENTTVNSAKIEVRDLFGALKSSITLTDITGLGQVSFSAGTLIDRYYVYSLIINNATIDTKLMLISHS